MDKFDEFWSKKKISHGIWVNHIFLKREIDKSVFGKKCRKINPGIKFGPKIFPVIDMETVSKDHNLLQTNNFHKLKS